MVNVVKATGETEPFSEIKIRSSIKRAGIPQKIQEEVVEHIKSKLYENIPTKEIYRHILEFLGQSSHPFNGTKYNLKQGIMDLGPTGYPFEDYISEILKSQGHTTQTRQILRGNCVSHEIDVIAEKDGKRIAVEAKFHNGLGTRSDVHVALYTKARFDDIKEKNDLDEAWIVTNTKATSDAITYAECNGIKVIGWNYPEKEVLGILSKKRNCSQSLSYISNSKSKTNSSPAQNCSIKNICISPGLIKILDFIMIKKKYSLN